MQTSTFVGQTGEAPMRERTYVRRRDQSELSECITLGDRVRMSEFGRERHPSYGMREGVVVGMGSINSLRVKFDDRNTIQAIHRNYLEIAPEITENE